MSEPNATEEKGYIALKPCGCFGGACTDNVPRNDLMKFFADATKAGCTIERRAIAEIRAGSWNCPHEKQDA